MKVLERFKKTHLKRLSIFDLTGTPPSFQELIDLFKETDAECVIFILSNIAVSLKNESWKTELYLREQLFSPEFKALLLSDEKKTGSKTAIFNEMALFLLIDVCRRYCPVSPAKPLNIGETGRQIAMGFLVANFFANLPQDENPEQSRESYARFAMREGIFNEKDQFRYSLGRARLIFEELRNQVPASKQFDVSGFLEEQFGFTLTDYHQAIVTLYSQWSSQSSSNNDPNRAFINLSTFFSATANHDRLEKVIRMLTQDWRPSGSIGMSSFEPKDVREYLYSHFELKSKPLVSLNGKIYPMSFKILTEMVWSGPYYLVIDRLRELNMAREPFFHFLGETTELYCRALLKHSFPTKFTTLNSIRRNPLGDCVIRINPRLKIVFEVKAKRPNFDAIAGNKAIAENSAVRMMFTEPLIQMSDRIAEYRKSYSGRILPVVVTMGSLNITELTWPIYFEQVKTLSMFSDAKVDHPIFLDAETLEILCACGQAGHSLAEIVRDKTRRTWRNEDFKNFLYYGYFKERNLSEPPNEPVRDASTETFNWLSKRLFDHEFEDGANDWKSVFSL